MSDPGPLFESRSLWRAAVLGIGVFFGFCLVAGILWWTGTAVGLETVPAFFVAICAAPLLVVGALALWLASLSLERRQKMLGIGPEQPPETGDDI